VLKKIFPVTGLLEDIKTMVLTSATANEQETIETGNNSGNEASAGFPVVWRHVT